MKRLLKNNSLLLLVSFFVVNSLFLPDKAHSFSLNPINFFEKTGDVIVGRVSDLIYFLIMQKRYYFDDYTDPNVYPNTETLNNSEPNPPVVQSNNTSSQTPSFTLVKINVIPPVNEYISYGNISQILTYTNNERVAVSLKPLSPNYILDTIASLRADDIFTNQYFEHSSPDGKSVTDLALKVGYKYLIIGENLAKGTFSGDKGIVSAWMGSEGHRANILNKKYKELGVAVKEGMFNGEKVTIAVQIFASPLADCLKPSAEAKYLIDNSSASIRKMQAEALITFNNLNAIKNSPGLDISYYNQKIAEYNYFAKKINDAILALKNMIDDYNISVNKYNSCIKN